MPELASAAAVASSRPSGTSNSVSAFAALRSAIDPCGATASNSTRRPSSSRPTPSPPTTAGSGCSM